MMWSKQKSPRFAEGRAASAIGPGSYELPSVWDDHATTINGQDRFQEPPAPETPGPGTYAKVGHVGRGCSDGWAEVTQKLEQELRSQREAKKSAPKARLEGEVRALKVQAEELQQALRQREAEALDAERRAASAEARLAEKELEASEANSTAQQSAEALRQREAEALDAERRAASAEARLAEKELEASEANSTAQQSAEEARSCRAKLAEMAEECNRLQGKLDDLHAGAQQMQADSQQYRQQLQASRCELDWSSAEVHRLQQEKEDLQSRLEKTQSKVCALELEHRQHEDYKEHLQTCAAALASAEAAKQEALAKYAELRGQHFGIMQAQEASQELIETLRGELAASEATKCALPEDSLSSLREQLASANAEKEILRADVDRLKFAEINANMTRSAKDRAEAQLRELKVDVENWRQKAQSFERDEERIKRQSQDILRLEHETKDLHQQNMQLLLTCQQFKAELENTAAENHSLQDTINMYEMNLQRATDEKAELMGHNNPKQKIRHMVNLKEENKELREQLKKAKQRITQLGVSRKGEGLLEALASFSHSHSVGADQLSVAVSAWAPETPAQKGATPKRSGTPTRKPGSARGARPNPDEDEYQARMAEEERRRQIQDRAVERVQTDFQHFITLIERAVLTEDCVEDSPNPAALLERLRAIAGKKDLQSTGAVDSWHDGDALKIADCHSRHDEQSQVNESGDAA